MGFNALRCSGVPAGLDSSECVSQVSVSLWSDGDDGGFRIRMSVSLTACVCVCVLGKGGICFVSSAVLMLTELS